MTELWTEAIDKGRPSPTPFGDTFPGLTPPLADRVAPDPFAALAAAGATQDYLMIVPCNRPADAVAIIGGLACETDGETITAVLRSFEERHAANLVAIEPSLARLAAPPITDHDRALRLAAELWAFCPPDEPLEIDAIANQLTTPPHPTDGQHRDPPRTLAHRLVRLSAARFRFPHYGSPRRHVRFATDEAALRIGDVRPTIASRRPGTPEQPAAHDRIRKRSSFLSARLRKQVEPPS
jgi:hypothetical protein